MPEMWIVIPRWDEFQHRDMARSSQPPWIKNFTRLYDDDDYLNLSLMQRGVLHGLWILYARHRRVLSEVGARSKLVTSAAEARRWRDTIEALNHAGYIILSASKPASRHASKVAGLEVEVEVEVPGTTTAYVSKAVKNPRPPGNETTNGNGLGHISEIIEASLHGAP